MFKGLRWRLTLLYLFAALALIALIAFGVYTLLDRYLQSTTDLALQYKMAQQLRSIGAALSPELARADATWNADHHRDAPVPPPPSNEGESESENSQVHTDDRFQSADTYDGDLAAIFVSTLNAGGQPVAAPNTIQPPVFDQAAVTAALANGTDWRTVQLSDGTRVRLLTYRVNMAQGETALQMGRTLADQDRVLNQLLVGLAILGGLSAIVLGAGSWWLAGRSLVPAQQAFERQQAFVANASHELRAPLTLMRASAEVALRDVPAADADRRSLLGDVLQEVDHMSHLVDDLLLLSRLDAKRLKLERTAISLRDLFADVQRQVGRVSDERGVRLTASAIDRSAMGDVTRLRQVLLIVLDNALRHTPRGGSIEMTARSSGKHIQIDVADSGEGIAPKHLPHVFERFYRADSTPGKDGSGLGLAIAKGLIEAQHGSIAIASEPGRGTQVTLTLPGAE